VLIDKPKQSRLSGPHILFQIWDVKPFEKLLCFAFVLIVKKLLAKLELSLLLARSRLDHYFGLLDEFINELFHCGYVRCQFLKGQHRSDKLR
jgi:hypothetical protein